MGGIILVSRIVFFVCLLLPFIIRFLILKKPSSLRTASIFAVIYAVVVYFFVEFISSLRMAEYVNSKGLYDPYHDSYGVIINSISLYFWQGVFVSIIVLLGFYFVRWVMRIGGEPFRVAIKNENKTWWSVIWIRQLVFFVSSFAIVVMGKCIEVMCVSG